MSSTRLTRAQSQEKTKRRLLAAARAIVEREGLSAVTVSRIAADAGLTTGAVYSNFKGGRAELLLKVAQDLVQPLHGMPPVDGGAGAWLRGVAAVLADHTESPGALSLATELISIALRDSSVLQVASAMARDSVEEIAKVLDEVGGASAVFDSREVAVLVMAMFAGLAQYRSLLGVDAVPIELCARAFSVLAEPPAMNVPIAVELSQTGGRRVRG